MSMTRVQLLLGKVAEECSEVAQRALKAQQFGLDEVQQGQAHTNRERLMGELVDLQGILLMLEDEDSFNYTRHQEYETDPKKAKVEKFIQLSQILGMVEKVSTHMGEEEAVRCEACAKYFPESEIGEVYDPVNGGLDMMTENGINRINDLVEKGSTI